jgi:hypothetical protein
MKHFHSILTIVLMMNAGVLTAQHRPMGRPSGEQGVRMEALRVAFFTEALELSSEDAELFWPVMRAHQDDMESIRTELDSIRNIVALPQIVSDEQALACLEALERLHAQECAAKSAMLRSIAEVLGVQRALQIPVVEDKFRRRIFEEVQSRRMQPPARRPRP